MIVIITDKAEADLERVGDFIARGNAARAVTLVSKLADRCLRLADAPRAFPLVPRATSIPAFVAVPMAST